MDGEDNHAPRGWRKEVGKSLLVLANVVAGSLVFGQLLNENVRWIVFAAGIFATTLLYLSAIIMLKKQ